MNLSGYKKVEYTINQRPARERWLILLAGGFVVFWLWSNLIYNHVVSAQEGASRQIGVAQKNLTDTEKQLTSLLAEIKKDPIKNLQDQKDQLSGQVNSMNAELKALMDNLVNPKEMLILLKTILENQSGLTLVAMENKSPELIKIKEPPAPENTEVKGALPTLKGKKPVAGPPKADATKVEAVSAPRVLLYRHGLEITFSGPFFKVVDYLKSLESVKKKIIWDSIDYSVTAYPVAEVKLNVMTISTNEGWLGV